MRKFFPMSRYGQTQRPLVDGLLAITGITLLSALAVLLLVRVPIYLLLTIRIPNKKLG